MKEVASLIGRAIKADIETESGRAETAAVAEEVSALVARFPAYPAPSA
jgi:glycine hydroxymethyltransferase